MTGSKTQSCPRLKMLLKLPLCFAHLFHVLIPSLAFKDHYVSLQKGLPGMKSKLSCLNGVGKETALAKNSRHTGFGHTRDDTKHCSATPVCGVNHSPPWTSGILEEHLPLSSTLTELLYLFKGMEPETGQGRSDREGVLWKGARPN